MDIRRSFRRSLRRVYSGRIDIWIINVDGSEVTKMTSKGGVLPCWSPDGSELAFTSLQGESSKKNWDIWKIAITGANLQQLTSSPGTDITPIWTKNNEIYFLSNRGLEKEQFRIWKMVPKKEMLNDKK